MKTLAKLLPLLLLALLSSLLLAGQAQAAVSCQKINAKGVGQDHFNGITTANVLGGGLLHGTVVEHYTISGTGPVFHFESTQIFTTKQGTLTANIPGTFDVRDGHFAGAGTVIDATGKLAGATGTITLDGVENLPAGDYTDAIYGQICVDLAP